MLALYSSKAVYNKGGDFPLISISTDMKDAQDMDLTDFQWWAYSEDFKGWLSKHPREWTADSVDTSVYSKTSSPINESIIKDRASNFSDFILENDQSSDDALAKDSIKFHYAYNSLLAQNKIKDSLSFSNSGGDLAVFMMMKDDNGQPLDETLKAFRMSPSAGDTNKLAIMNVSETLPGGKLPDNASSESIFQTIADNSGKLALWGIGGLTVFGLLKVAGGLGGLFTIIGLRRVTNALKNFGKVVPKVTKPSRTIKYVKSLWGFARDLIVLKRTRQAGKIIKDATWIANERVRLARAAGKTRKLVLAGRWAGGFGKGLRAGEKVVAQAAGKTGAKLGSRLIPYVGEVLIATDIIASSWNWWSGRQAPMYSDLKKESWIKDHFNPKEVEIGKAITVCFSQGKGGASGFLSGLFFNADTRTTMELVKIAENGGSSIFILAQINSKEMQKMVAENDMTLLSFSNSRDVRRGYIDNDDLKFKISFQNGLSSAESVPSIFSGYCSWSELMSAYGNSESQLITADPNAPETFDFNFKDSEKNVINVSGKKISSDTLAKLTDDELMIIFGVTEISSSGVKEHRTFKELKDSGYIFEGEVMKFGDFNNKISGIFENDDENTGDVAVLTPKQKSSPAVVSAYNITKKEYANPELIGKDGYGTGSFMSFLLDAKGYGSSDDEQIDVFINTDEFLDDCRMGLYKYDPSDNVASNDDSEDQTDDQVDNPDDTKLSDLDADGKTKRKTAPLTRGGDDDESNVRYRGGSDVPDYVPEPKSSADDVKANPRDVSVSSNRRSTEIEDTPMPGGVNIFDKFLTYKEKEILSISNWKNITFAKEILDRAGNVIEIKLSNKYASFGDRKRRYSPQDGESFEIARNFVEEVKDRIKSE